MRFAVEPQFFDLGLTPYDRPVERDLHIANTGGGLLCMQAVPRSMLADISCLHAAVAPPGAALQRLTCSAALCNAPQARFPLTSASTWGSCRVRASLP